MKLNRTFERYKSWEFADFDFLGAFPCGDIADKNKSVVDAD